MKIKDDIILWKEECTKLKEQIEEFDTNSEKSRADVSELTIRVQKLTTTLQQIADNIIALIRQQLGD